MRNVKITFLFGFLMMMISCESPLSDVEFDNPDLINAQINIVKTIENGSVSEKASVILTDKNLAFVELKNGSVKVNSETLDYIGVLKGYETEVQFNYNTEYTFTIELADGERYKSFVTTPEKDFGTVDMPDQVLLNNNISVAWSKFNTSENIKIRYILVDTDDNWHYVIESSIKDNGSYTINHENIKLPKEIMSYSHAIIKLEKSKKGSLNSDLRGGTISSDIIYSETINVKS